MPKEKLIVPKKVHETLFDLMDFEHNDSMLIMLEKRLAGVNDGVTYAVGRYISAILVSAALCITAIVLNNTWAYRICLGLACILYVLRTRSDGAKEVRRIVMEREGLQQMIKNIKKKTGKRA